MNIYDDVLEIAKNYMGLAAEEYIARRCRVSLGIDAKKLEKKDLNRLMESIAMTAEVYVGADKVKKFKEELLALARKA
jgi:hypothetical protein